MLKIATSRENHPHRYCFRLSAISDFCQTRTTDPSSKVFPQSANKWLFLSHMGLLKERQAACLKGQWKPRGSLQSAFPNQWTSHYINFHNKREACKSYIQFHCKAGYLACLTLLWKKRKELCEWHDLSCLVVSEK